MRQPRLAPAALGGSLFVGIAAMVVGIWAVADCARYQSKPGECNAVVEANALPIVTGLAAILAGWGGFYSVNPALDRPEPGRPARDPSTGRFMPRKRDD